LAVGGLFFGISDGLTKAKTCDKTPTGVEAEDYFLSFKTENMPDKDLNGLDAEIRVHRVKPVYANGKCPGVINHAAVLVHGRAAGSNVTFDVQLPDLSSTQELLASAGIDTFAPDLLGYGYSSRLSMDDPCNASYPGCVAQVNGSCPANAPNFIASANACSASPVGCDRSPNPASGALDQQRKPDAAAGPGDGVRVNPLNHQPNELCPHSSNFHFANNDVWARDIIQVIEDAIEKATPHGNKVVLIGYSLGGVRVARTLYLLGQEADHLVRRVVFWSSLFNRTLSGANVVDDTVPTEENDPSAVFPTFPLQLGGFGGLTALRGTADHVKFCGGNPSTAIPDPSRYAPGTSSLFRQQHRDLEDPTKDPRYPNGDWQDLFGLEWGGTLFGSPTGLNRVPTFTRYGWNPEIAHTFTLPTLILNGLDDNLAIVENSTNIFNELTSVANKVLVQVDCAGHQMQSEICGADGDGDGVACEPGERCCQAAPGTIYGTDSGTWAGPHSTVAAALIEWVKYGTFDHSECGRFLVDASGVPSEVPTANCPVLP